MKEGIYTTEFWVSSISSILAAALALLVAYGYLTSEQSSLWMGLGVAVVSLVAALVIGSIAKNYTTARTDVKIAKLMQGEGE